MTEAACPSLAGRDDRRSAAIAADRIEPLPGAVVTGDFALAREILRSPVMRQAGAGAEHVVLDDPEKVPLFFLDGEIHRQRRGQLARFFTPKAIKERHRLVMERTTAELIGKLRRTGRERLDLMSMQLACDVAAEIVGLTNSNPRAMATRIRMTFMSIGLDPRKPVGRIVSRVLAIGKTLSVFWFDVRPAIKARRKQRQDDVISYLLDEGFSDKQIMIECMTYATAGMLTTREFIVMVAWQLFEDDALREQFLTGDEEVQFAILDEILRLDPVAAMVYRKAAEDMDGPGGQRIKAGETYGIDIRAANLDEASAGACPFAIDIERGKRQRMTSSWMSFGDGPHRCPGSQVALHETRVFIEALLRVPGIRLANPPTLGWCAPIGGYELHGAFVECGRN